MPEPRPFDLSPAAVRNAHSRLSGAQRKFRTGKLSPMEKWSRESRYWSLRPTLFEAASGLEYQAILRHQKEHGAEHFDPTDRIAARARALKDVAKARDSRHDLSMVVLDHWNYWLHFSDLIEKVFELRSDDLHAMVAKFDHDLVEAVRALDTEIRHAQEDRQRMTEAIQEEVADRESRLEELMESPPCPCRMEAQLVGDDRLKLRLVLTDEDLRGHRQLMHPILNGLWELFEPHAVSNGLLADHERGVFEVTTAEIMKMDAFLDDFSESIRSILDLDRRLISPLSLTKSAELLGISRSDLEQLVSVREINPISIVTLTSGGLSGVQFLAFAVQDVLELKAVLDDLYEPRAVAWQA